MATTVDTLLVRIEADMSDLKRSLNKVQRDVDNSSRGISGAFKKIGTAMKVAVAGVLVQQAIRGGAAMINLASDIEEMQGKSKVVFGAFRNQVVSDLEEFGNAVGRSTHELEGMASSIQDTFVPMGFGRGEAAKLSVELTKLAVDVASFNNASDTETMEAFQSALVGNHETVRRFGVVITEATLNQELMRMGIEKGSKAASNAEKVQARLNLITKGTSDASGDAMRTSDSFANSVRGLKAELSELASGIMVGVLPAAAAIVHALKAGAEAAKEFLQNLGLIDTPLDIQFDKNAAAIAATTKELEEARAGFKTYSDAIKENPAILSTAEGAGIGAAADRVAQLEQRLSDLKREKDRIDEDIVMNQGVPSAPFKSPVFAPAEETMAAVKRMALIREQIRLQGALSQATKDGNELKIHAAQRELAAMNDVGDLTDEQVQREYDLQLARTGSHRVLADTVDQMENVYSHSLVKHKEQYNDIIASMAAYQAQAQKGKDTAMNLVDEHLDIKKSLKDVEAAYQSGLISFELYSEAMEKLKAKMEELDPLYKQLTDRANQAFDTMADSLTDMVMRGKIDLQSLGSMFKQTVREMIADAIKAQMIKPLLGGVFGAIGTAIGGPVGGFLGNMAANAIGGSADGGNLNANMPQIVGERGPELIVPKSASNIMNNHNTKNALGGGRGTIIQQTINVSAGVSQTVKAEMVALLPRFKQETMRGVVDAKRRGGSYGQAFG